MDYREEKFEVCDDAKINRRLYFGDHFLDGKGLMTRPTEDREIIRQRKDSFVFENIIKEVVDRKRDGVLGREPNWRIVRKDGEELSDADNVLISEFTSAAISWWNERKLLETEKKLIVDALLARKSYLRPFSPVGMRDEKGNVKAQETLSSALDLLHFENVSTESASVRCDEMTLKPYSTYKYIRAGQSFTDFSFVDADGVTHFKTFTDVGYIEFAQNELPTIAKYIAEETGDKTTSEHRMILGGKLHLFEMDLGEAFITAAIRSLQKKHNLDLTMEGRNSYTAGFRERHFLGADAPETLAIGAGAASYTQGVPIYDNDGKIIGTTSPSLTVIEPVDPKTFHQSQLSNYAKILSQAEQKHVVMNDAATVSGISRAEARAEFRTSLLNIKQPTDASIRYIIEFAMSFAAALTNRTEAFAAFRVDADCVVSAGIPSPEEKEANRKSYEAGEIDIETLRVLNGTDDADAMAAKIKAAPDYELNYTLDVFEKAQTAVPVDLIVELLPFDEATKTRIRKYIPKVEEEAAVGV